jgi:hypothetical protein
MKQHYSKPSLNRIELVADQAVLSNCKVVELAPGPNYSPGVIGDCEVGSGTQCFTFGS